MSAESQPPSDPDRLPVEEPKPGREKIVLAILGVFVAVYIAGIVYFRRDPTAYPDIPPTRAAVGSRVAMGRDTIGCTWAIHQRIAEYSNANDVEGAPAGASKRPGQRRLPSFQATIGQSHGLEKAVSAPASLQESEKGGTAGASFHRTCSSESGNAMSCWTTICWWSVP
jgi:hypothetical protein